MAVRLVPAEDLNLTPRIGLAKLTKCAFDGEDLNAIWADLVHNLKADPENIEAAMDLSVIAQLVQQQVQVFEPHHDIQLALAVQPRAKGVRDLGEAHFPARRGHDVRHVLREQAEHVAVALAEVAVTPDHLDNPLRADLLA